MRLIYFFISLIFSFLIIVTGVQHILSSSLRRDPVPRAYCPGLTTYDRQLLSVLRKDLALPIFKSRTAAKGRYLFSSLRKHLTPQTHASRLTLHASRFTPHASRLLTLNFNWLSILRTDVDPDSTITDSILSAGEIQPEQYVAADTVIQGSSNARSQNPWLWEVNYFGKSFKLVNALIITIVISTLTMIILLIIILLNRTRMEREQKLRQFLLEKYQGLIVEYLYGDVVSDQFLQIASDGFRRQVLIDQIIDVSINLKGDSEEKLNNLYTQLGLYEDSIRKAYSRKWHYKVKGFRELAFMNNKDANDEIFKSLNSGNEILRMEAQIALVRLGGENPFMFLGQLKRPFSLWEQITLHELLIQHTLPVPAFRQWLDSPNPTVIMFALRMIREFKQQDAEEDITKVLSHPEPRVKHLAIEVAGDLNMRSSLEMMKKMYKNEDYNNCTEILRSMAKMPDPSMLGFLKLVLDKEDDVQLQIEATRAIENMGEVGVAALVKLMKSEYKNYNIIIRHVLDRRIN